MAKTVNSALVMLTQIADKDLSQASSALGQATQTAQAAQSKHELLQGYRQDYIAQLEPMLTAGLNAISYQNYCSFISKLDRTITSQHEVLVSALQLVQMQGVLWQKMKRKKRAYEVLTERYSRERLKLELSREQKLMDEFAMRSSLRK
jgi:flagellar FliJ protein